MDELSFEDLLANMGVDINPETAEVYRTEIEWFAQTSEIDLTGLYGRYLIVTPEGPSVLDAAAFHQRWKFYSPYEASRMVLRSIIPR